MPASYSPEDNKLRLYVGRVPREDYERLRAAGFTSTPKQDCDFVATWTPGREDIAREFLDDGEDIDDEDYSPEERAADRAERFSGYRDKRAGEAGASADAFDAGPSAFGHQNRGRAERQAARHDRKRVYAVSQWSKAEYWQERTAGVIEHALHRSDARTRRGRILTLEADQRKHEASLSESASRRKLWQAVAGMEGAETPLVNVRTTDFIGIAADTPPAGRAAYALANSGSCWGQYRHPRTGAESSLYSHLTDAVDPITPAEAAALYLSHATDPADDTSYSARWSRHLDMRLAYERAMLANEGGSAADAEMEPGGWLRVGSTRWTRHLVAVDGWSQVLRVNKSPATKRVTSVVVLGRDPFAYADPAEGQKIRELTINIERAGDDAYRAPTDAEREAFAQATKARKAEKKAATPKAPPLINPTDEDAERLQAIWNQRAKESHIRMKSYGDPPQSTVKRMTQAEYSAASKGSYARCHSSDITEQLRKRQQNYTGRELCGRVVVFKLRTTSGSSAYSHNAPERVIVITDKPRKSIPWESVETVRSEQPTIETMTPRLGELQAALSQNWLPESGTDAAKLIDDAVYLGWAFVSSQTQFGWMDTGADAFKAWMSNRSATPESVNA